MYCEQQLGTIVDDCIGDNGVDFGGDNGVDFGDDNEDDFWGNFGDILQMISKVKSLLVLGTSGFCRGI